MEALSSLPHHVRYFLPSDFSVASSCGRFLFMLFTILISWLSSHCNGACEKPFTCGNYILHYPFGWKNRGCGDPALQLDCDRGYGMPLLNITGHQYYILAPQIFFEGNSSHTMTIIDKNIWSKPCEPFSSNNTAQFWSGHQFHIVDNYKNITLWDDCDEKLFKNTSVYRLQCGFDGYYVSASNSSLATAYCNSQVKLPVRNNTELLLMVMLDAIILQGFEIRWNFSKGCEYCGSCKYDNITMRPYCETDEITNQEPLRKSNSKTFVIILVCSVEGVAVAAAVLVVFIYYWRRREHENPRSVSKVETFLHKYVDEMPTRYSYSSLKKITSNFARKEEDHILNWDQLYSIALGAARGIAYLHDDCHSRIIHFDIKPHNILLDEEFTAKVADFGLAKLCGRRDDHVSMTEARGTPGYVAPEVWSRNLGPVTDKSDVYGFGMMLLEMVAGRKNIDVQVSHSSQFYFPDWAIKLVERGELRTRLRERELSETDEAKARSMTKVGLWCIQHNSTDRPSMVRVLQMLERDADDIPNPPTPSNARP